MFKVECPGCKAPYQVDERRIPANGLKMRCPKCGSSFKVDPPSDAHRAAGAALGLGADSVPPPALASPEPRTAALKATMLGVGAPGAAPPRVGPPPAPVRPARAAAPVAEDFSHVELDLPSPAEKITDLPAPVAPKRGPPAFAPHAKAPEPSRTRSPNPGPAAFVGALDTEDDADLPAPRSPSSANLPAIASSGHRGPSPDLNLPSIADKAPTPSGPVSARFGEIELDLPSPTDLPAVGGSKPPFRPSGALSLDLPSPTLGTLPSLSGGRELELPRLQETELPSPRVAELPSVSRAGMPVVSATGLPKLGNASLPSAIGAGLPSNSAESFSVESGDTGLDLEPLVPSVPAFGRTPSSTGSSGAFGELDLPPMAPAMSSPPGPRREETSEADPFGEADLPPQLTGAAAEVAGSSPPRRSTSIHPSAQGSPLIREAGGGTAYGELNFGDASSDEADVPIQAPAPARASIPSEEDMEFGALPQESAPTARAVSSPARALPRSTGPSQPADQRPRSRAGLRIAIGLGVVVLGGASLSFVPQLGPFGAFFVIDRVRAGEHQKFVDDAVKRARAELSADSASQAARAATGMERARETMPRLRALLAYAAFVASARELRFGSDPEIHSRAKVALDDLADQSGVPFLELARAARAATEGQLARARQLLSGLQRDASQARDALVVAGEVELRARDAPAALRAWQALAKLEVSARSAFGLARAHFAAGDTASAERDAERALVQNPAHVGARILLARILAGTGKEPQAVKLLEAIAKQKNDASPDEFVSASTLLGDIHLARSRITRAEAAFTEALKINPKAARALIGLGEALYRSGRYSEAQARFEASAQADPDDVFSKVGVAKSKLSLERVEEAQASLKKLQETHPASLLVAYWYGRVLEAVGNRAEAEKVYAKAITDPKSDPVLVDAYIALALLQNQEGRATDAQNTLSAAKRRLPSSSAIHRALGDVAITQGRYSDAISELQKALEIDPEDLGARFRLGVALRRDRKVDEALKVFEEVSVADKEYPGLALERGLLFETSGQTEEALKAYEGALAKAPTDPDLMLRVGCGYATAGRTKEAEQLLRKVLAQRPTSAETNHCLGRALLSEGSRLADALRLLDRAVELDPHRAEHHLYVGWAANEAGNVAKAERALNQAIQLDQSLADAYWQRGVLRQRQGAVRDAIADLTRALQLRPTRYEAHAALADAYYDLGKEALALAEWQKAVAARPDNATWRFRYGKLLVDNHMNDAARVELTRALDLAKESARGERWLWEAHHRLARAIGQKPESIPHWEAFLRHGPLDSPYRAEAKTALEHLGRPWSGN